MKFELPYRTEGFLVVRLPDGRVGKIGPIGNLHELIFTENQVFIPMQSAPALEAAVSMILDGKETPLLASGCQRWEEV